MSAPALADEEIDRRLDEIDAAMSACIDRGMKADGILPGGLKVKRRAPALHRLLTERAERALQDPLTVIDWVNLWALAVNEENAAGGKVVTAPTNGAAGIVPAVLRYYQRFTPRATHEGTPHLPAHRRGDRLPVQGKCLDLRRRGGLPGRGRRRLLDGRGGADRGARRHARRRSRMPPRSAWSTISASPAIRSAASSRPPRPDRQVRPRLCSMAISAALDLRGRAAERRGQPAAAIEQATPTSPWQPTSAPEIEAFFLNSEPIAAAVSRKMRVPSGVPRGVKR